jgi:hypothetical protein
LSRQDTDQCKGVYNRNDNQAKPSDDFLGPHPHIAVPQAAGHQKPPERGKTHPRIVSPLSHPPQMLEARNETKITHQTLTKITFIVVLMTHDVLLTRHKISDREPEKA